MTRAMKIAALPALFVALLVLTLATPALATTYKVGPGQEYTELEPLMRDVLQAGDIIEVEGDHEYAGDLVMWGGNWPGAATGTADAPVIVRGIRKNGKRPVIKAGADWGIVLYMNYTVFEGFEVTGGGSAAIVHKADHVLIRDVLVRDCPGQGILGTDGESGSLTMEYVEVTRCGEGLYNHSIYIAGDESMYPGHVFRMQHCWVHDGNGGNSVKSRAERNEIYANWIEGALYHELDLIGPVDPAVEGLAREDSDVVGNVLVKSPTSEYGCLRAGGDGNLSSNGRYRFVNNTCLLSPLAGGAFFLQYGMESLEMSNNIIVGGSPDTVLAITVDGASPAFFGTNNLIASNIALMGSAIGPITLENTLSGDPGFVDQAGWDLRPRVDSPLVDAGADPIPSFTDHPFPSPLALPEYLPPPRQVEESLTSQARPRVGALDIGAYEYGSPDPGVGGAGAGGAGSGGGGAADGDSDGCGCRFATDRCAGSGVISVVGLLLALRFRPRRRVRS